MFRLCIPSNVVAIYGLIHLKEELGIPSIMYSINQKSRNSWQWQQSQAAVCE